MTTRQENIAKVDELEMLLERAQNFAEEIGMPSIAEMIEYPKSGIDNWRETGSVNR